MYRAKSAKLAKRERNLLKTWRPLRALREFRFFSYSNFEPRSQNIDHPPRLKR